MKLSPQKRKGEISEQPFLQSAEDLFFPWVNWGGKERVREVSSEHFGAEGAELSRFGNQMHLLIPKMILKTESRKDCQIKLIL